MSGTLPTVVTLAGLQPQAPTDLNAQVIAAATALSPGLTANLPGSLIEDMGSTATGAVVVMDQARVDLVNSLTPFGANEFLLNQLGQVYGIKQGQDTNTSVFVVFSGVPGKIINPGFTVSDGTFQYIIQDGGIVNAGGTTQPLFAIATQPGTWSVPPNTVTQFVTSITTADLIGPPPLTVTNPLAGTPSAGGQTEEDYRSQVLQAGLASATGMTTFLKTLLNQVPGVISRLVSVRQQTGGGWEVLVGGNGDPFQVAYSIFRALFDISTLVGSSLVITGVTNANPAIVTTSLNHGYTGTRTVVIAGATGIVGLNGTFTATVLSQTTFSIPLNTITAGTYTGNGIVTPNFRNVTVSISDYPDVYVIPLVIPPAQTVAMTVTWNTNAIGLFVSAGAVVGAAQPALAAYINALPVGQPINVFELTAAFQAAVAPLVPLAQLTRIVFTVSINGIGVSPTAGTGTIAGDPESYFTIVQSAITINQG